MDVPLEVAFLKKGLVDPSSFGQEGQNFLERMRHTSSFELVRQIKVFITAFLSHSGSPDQFSDMMQDFLERMSVMIADHQLWRDEEEEGLAVAMEALERYLLCKMYMTAFYLPTSTDTRDDEEFYHRVRTLQFLQPDHLDIPSRPLNQIAVEMAAKELNRLKEENLRSPREKLSCILNAVTIIINLLKHYSSTTGADDMIPYLIYIILLASPKHIHSNLRYIQRFRRPVLISSEESYYLTQMESAVLFISSASPESLSISPEHFQRGVAEAEERISRGEDIPRRFSDSSWDSLLTDFNKGKESPLPTTGQELLDPSPALTLPTSDLPSSPEDTDGNGRSLCLEMTNLHMLPSVQDCIIPKFLEARFEELTILDLKRLFSCYQQMVKRLQEMEKKLTS